MAPDWALSAAAEISIHALREEGDGLMQLLWHYTRAISIHALREEGDVTVSPMRRAPMAFLSTPSARRATLLSEHFRLDAVQISIHALREEGDVVGVVLALVNGISIHALREEGDTASPSSLTGLSTFLSTPSARRATMNCTGHSMTPALFLSTPSARRATQSSGCRFPRLPISIHALREEGDAIIRMSLPATPNFYPRPPRGGRR